MSKFEWNRYLGANQCLASHETEETNKKEEICEMCLCSLANRLSSPFYGEKWNVRDKRMRKKFRHFFHCKKKGHTSKFCWYNPNVRGVMLSNMSKKHESKGLAKDIMVQKLKEKMLWETIFEPKWSETTSQYNNWGWRWWGWIPFCCHIPRYI